MHTEILKFLGTQRTGVLAVEMLDGSPHGATVHFAHHDNPFEFFFETYREYRKVEPLLKNETTRASFVVGCDESTMKTMQLDGVVELLKSEEKETFDLVYFEKFPEKEEKSKRPKVVFFKLTPTWWRFTDWTAPEGKTIYTSDGNVEVLG